MKMSTLDVDINVRTVYDKTSSVECHRVISWEKNEAITWCISFTFHEISQKTHFPVAVG